MHQRSASRIVIDNSTAIIALSGIVGLLVCLFVLFSNYFDNLRQTEINMERSEFPSLVAAVNQGFDACFQPTLKGLGLLASSFDWTGMLEEAVHDSTALRKRLRQWSVQLRVRTIEVADRNRQLVYCDWSPYPVRLDPDSDRDSWFFEFWNQKPLPELSYNLYSDGGADLSLYIDQIIHDETGAPIGSLGSRIPLYPLRSSIIPMLLAEEHVLLVDKDGKVLLDLSSLSVPAGKKVYGMDGLSQAKTSSDTRVSDRFLGEILAGEKDRGSVDFDTNRYLFSRHRFWGSTLTAVILVNVSTASAGARNRLLSELILMGSVFLVFMGGVILMVTLLNKRIVDISRLLQRSNDQLEELVSVLSHDLGNELMVLQQNWDRMESLVMSLDCDDAGNLANTSSLRLSIRNGCRSIRTLLQNSINISRLDSFSKLTLHREFDFSWLWNKLVSVYSEVAAEKSQHFEMLPVESCWVINDEDMLFQILSNLIHNAIKFTPEGGTVRVSAEYGKDMLQIFIADSGPGFSDEDRKGLFGKFKRLSARPTKGENSTGLGLYIVKQLANACNTRVELLDAGSTSAGLGGAVWRLQLYLPITQSVPETQVAHRG